MSSDQRLYGPASSWWVDLAVGLILVGVLVLVFRSYDMSVKSRDGAEFESGSTLANLAGSIRDDTGFHDGRENMGGYEPPVFWNAGEMADIAENQQRSAENNELSMQDLDPMNLAFMNKADLMPQNRPSREGYTDDQSLGPVRTRGYAGADGRRRDGMAAVPSVNGQPLNAY